MYKTKQQVLKINRLKKTFCNVSLSPPLPPSGTKLGTNFRSTSPKKTTINDGMYVQTSYFISTEYWLCFSQILKAQTQFCLTQASAAAWSQANTGCELSTRASGWVQSGMETRSMAARARSTHVYKVCKLTQERQTGEHQTGAMEDSRASQMSVYFSPDTSMVSLKDVTKSQEWFYSGIVVSQSGINKDLITKCLLYTAISSNINITEHRHLKTLVKERQW